MAQNLIENDALVKKLREDIAWQKLRNDTDKKLTQDKINALQDAFQDYQHKQKIKLSELKEDIRRPREELKTLGLQGYVTLQDVWSKIYIVFELHGKILSHDLYNIIDSMLFASSQQPLQNQLRSQMENDNSAFRCDVNGSDGNVKLSVKMPYGLQADESTQVEIENLFRKVHNGQELQNSTVQEVNVFVATLQSAVNSPENSNNLSPLPTPTPTPTPTPPSLGPGPGPHS